MQVLYRFFFYVQVKYSVYKMAVRVSKKRQKCGGSVGFIDFLKEKGGFTVDFFSLGIGKKVLGKNRCIVYNKVSHFFQKRRNTRNLHMGYI